MEGPSTRVILASSSPRRKYLMDLLGVPFTAEAAGWEEVVLPGEPPETLAMRLAEEKALRVALRWPGHLVVGADTIVVLDGRILGKPASRDDACRMLEALSGRTHRVVTGVAVIQGCLERILADREVTEVDFDDLSDQIIQAYVETGEPMDKAGAYAIQGKGAILVKGIRGCYFNVVGLPLRRLSQMLSQSGVRVLG